MGAGRFSVKFCHSGLAAIKMKRKAAGGFTLVEVLVTAIVLAIFSLFLFRAFFRQISALEILSAKLDIMSHYHRHEAESRLFINQGTAEQSVASRQDTFKAGGRDVRYTETVFSNEEQRGLWRKTLDYSWSIGSKTVHVKYEFLYAEPVAGKT